MRAAAFPPGCMPRSVLEASRLNPALEAGPETVRAAALALQKRPADKIVRAPSLAWLIGVGPISENHFGVGRALRARRPLLCSRNRKIADR